MYNNFGLILADTIRSKAYITNLLRERYYPKWILILGNNKNNNLPGGLSKNFLSTQNEKDYWTKFDFDHSKSLTELLDEYNLKYIKSKSKDINSDEVISSIKKAGPEIIIYSGYGGVILKEKVLSQGKKFLHVHGGFLPQYKGSTTNYYSILNEGYIAASSIIMSNELDSGPILLRKKFKVPKNKILIDDKIDSIIRAQLLILTLKKFEGFKKPINFSIKKRKGELFFIIHPVLKHISILSKKEF